MGIFKEVLRRVKNEFDPEHPDRIGYVYGFKRSAGPRSRLIDIISHGNGDCSTKEEIVDITGFPFKTSEPYIEELKEQGLLEERQITRPRNGKVIDLICLTDEAKEPFESKKQDFTP